MPSVEGLSEVGKLMDQNVASVNNAAKMEAAKQAAELFKSGDIKGALSTILQHDPDKAQQLINQFQSYDPATQQAVHQGQEAGKIGAQTAAGVNEAQIQELRNKGVLDAAQAKAKQEPSAREQRLSNNFNQNMAFKYQQSAESSPLYKSGIGVINEMPQLKALLDDAYKNGGQSLAMLGPRIAKGLAGEVGVLTEQDVTRYISNPALARSILSKGEKAFEGKLTAQDYSNLVRLGTIMEKNAQQKMDKAYKQAATKLHRNLGIPMDEAELLVNPNLDEQTKSVLSEPHAESKEKTSDLKMLEQAMDAEEWLADPANAKHPKRKEVEQKLKKLGL